MRVRRLRWLGAAALAAGATACGYSGPPAATLLRQAKAAFDSTPAFHMQLSSQGTPGSGLVLTGASGDAVRPDGFTGTLDVEENGLPVQVGVISTGGHFYAKLPFTGAYVVTDPAQYGFSDPGKLLDPDTGISSLLPATEDPTIGSSTRYNGETLQEVDGTLPGQKLAAVLIDADPSQPVSVTYGIDLSTHQVRTVDLTGPIDQAGHDSTYHLVITDYGESVRVTPPPA
jgi:hypothetical protein